MLPTINNSKGFTLIEMVVTIVIIGIIGVGISNFIGRSVQGMVDTGQRQQLAATGWLVSEKVSRALRLALPNSIRLNAGGTCLEYIPIVAGSDYLSVPILSTVSSFEAVPFSNLAVSDDFSAVSYRVAVYPSTITDLYEDVSSANTQATISSLITDLEDTTSDPAVTPNAVKVELAAAHRFITDSPTNRFFVVRQPEMFCFDGQFLYRYRDYGFRSNLPTSSLSNQSVMGSSLSAGLFTYSPGDLARSAVVSIAFNVLGDGGNIQSVDQEVQIRNVP